MPTAAWCRMMSGYNATMNSRFYDAAARLTEAQRRQDEGAFFGSLHRTLCHLVWADAAWMARFDGGAAPSATLAEGPDMIADFAEMRAARDALDARISGWAAALDDAALQGELRWYSQSAGAEIARPRMVAVTHLFLHQSHHRGQAHALLTRFGETVGVTDLPFLLT